jgi:outer membrane biosynthesis protein TonB
VKHRLLVYGFAISVVLHGALAPLVHAQTTQSEEQQPEISGTVGVVVSLDASSRIVGTRIQSSPSTVLNAPALAAARRVAADYLFSVEFTAQ